MAALSRFLDSPDGPDLTRPTAWLFGNEAWGLPRELLDLADDAVAVPDLRPGREPEPGRGRRGLPLRLRPSAARRGEMILTRRPSTGELERR